MIVKGCSQIQSHILTALTLVKSINQLVTDILYRGNINADLLECTIHIYNTCM